MLDGDFVGATMYEGRGAGQGPTASSVVADLVDIARERYSNTFAIPAIELKKSKKLPISEHVGSYYVRFMVLDKPGVFATIAGALKASRWKTPSTLDFCPINAPKSASVA